MNTCSRCRSRSAPIPPASVEKNGRIASHCIGLAPVPGLACRAQAEQLEPMGLDPVAALAGDLLEDAGHAAVADVGRAPAARADHVMVVGRLAGDEGMVARWQIEAFDEAEL